jgi:hypothetical protein
MDNYVDKYVQFTMDIFDDIDTESEPEFKIYTQFTPRETIKKIVNETISNKFENGDELIITDTEVEKILTMATQRTIVDEMENLIKLDLIEATALCSDGEIGYSLTDKGENTVKLLEGIC